MIAKYNDELNPYYLLASTDVAHYGIFGYACISQCRYHTNNLEDISWYATRHISGHAKRPNENDQSCKKHLHANPLCNHVDETRHGAVAVTVANYVLVFNIKVVSIGRSIVGLMCCEITTRWIMFVQQWAAFGHIQGVCQWTAISNGKDMRWAEVPNHFAGIRCSILNNW